MNDFNFLYDFLIVQPMWFLFLLVFLATVLIDVFYVFWIIKTVQKKPYQAGIFSILLTFCNVVAFMGILELYNILLLPALAGVFVGTVLGIKLQVLLEGSAASNVIRKAFHT